MILLLSSPEDGHARAVLRALASRGEEARILDLARLPARADVDLRLDTGGARLLLRDGRRTVEPARARAIWWRRPGRVALPAGLDDRRVRRASEQQWREALAGLWHATSARWVNDPVREDVASRKILQLVAAREAGLAIPRTCVTTRPARARAFVRACGRAPGGGWNAVSKLLAHTEDARRETRRVEDGDLGALDAVRWVPLQLQEYVDGVDLRVTVAGRSLFAAEVDARGTGHDADWRLMPWDVGRARLRPARLPAPVARRLLALASRLGLAYAAFDLRRRPGGEHVFLEVNPGGQWLFVEAATGLPITDAVARLLAPPAGRAGRPTPARDG